MTPNEGTFQGSAPFSLSRNQMNIWSLEQSAPGTPISNISATIRIKGRVDLVLLREAVSAVLRNDASLRTRILLRDGKVMQYHAAYSDPELPVLDFSSSDEAGFAEWAASFSRQPIFALEQPLYRFVLCRLGEQTAVLLVETHHIISDGWSQILLCNRITQAYFDLLAGKTPDNEPYPDYADFIASEQEYFASDSYAEDEAYWRSVLASSPEPASLKTSGGAAVSRIGKRRSFRLSQQLNHAIYSFCEENRVAPLSVFYMALASYLKRCGASDGIAIGMPVFNRSTFAEKQTTGMFVSTLPFVCEVSEDWSFRDFNDTLTENWFELLRHQHYPFTEMERIAGTGSPLFHIMLSYQDSVMLKSEDTSVTISGLWHYCGYQNEQLCIHITNLEDNRMYAVDYDYQCQLFSDDEISELHQYLCHMIESGLSNPDTPIRSLCVIGPEERERVLYKYNRSYALRSDRTPYEMLQSVAENSPRQVAVIHNGVRTTYRDLMELGNTVAAALPDPQQLVAVILPKDIRLFTALTGILQANCAWLIIPPELPDGRIREILRNASPDRILSLTAFTGRLGETDIPFIDVDTLPGKAGEIRRGKPEDLAYVVYTSGSTGTPKGAEIMQKSLSNLALAMAPVYGNDAVLSVCSIGFDAFLLESVIPLLCGRTVVLSDKDDAENPSALAGLILNYGIGFLSTTPSRLSALLNSPVFATASRRLRTVICGGEAFPGELLRRLRSCTDASIYNQYGPSEAAVAVSMSLLDNAERITAGHPMENCHLYVLDDNLQPLPENVRGELYIGGTCVGRGYRNDPEQTEKAFLDSPFVSGERLYRTGDLACWNTNGEIELAGRRDRQIKLRGLRVEPQEISVCLCRHPSVNDAAARVVEQNGQSLIYVYYTSKEPEIPEADLMMFLASFLPDYMLPSAILRVDAIPLTPNGKLDEQRLPVPVPAGTCDTPDNDRQERIIQIFRDVLGNPDIGADSNYFLSGGNSLNAMETISRIEEISGERIRVAALYVCKTPRGIDEYLSASGRETVELRGIRPAGYRDYYPLTPTQKSLYLQSALDPTGRAYQMPCAFLLPDGIDLERLGKAFGRLIDDEPLFRASFGIRDGEIVARIAEQVPFEIGLIEAADRREAFDAILAPFDLASAPLFRAAVWKMSPDKTFLLVSMHHIVGDGISVPILMERLDAFYRGTIPDSHLSLLDYACYLEGKTTAEDDLNWWLGRLKNVPHVTEIPLDAPRPKSFDFIGASETMKLSAAASAAADRFCEKYELTPYMFFAGVLGILFGRLCGTEDLVFGTPVSERSGRDLEMMTGPMMGTLPLRLYPQGHVSDYFAAVKDAAVGMLDHADTHLGEIVEALGIPHMTDRNPLYQILFQVRPLRTDRFILDGNPLVYIPVPTGTAKLDLSFEIAPEDGGYALYTDYAEHLFQRETIRYFSRCIEKTVLSLDCAREDSDLSELTLLSDVDRVRLIERPANARREFPRIPLADYIAEETLIHPDDIAVVSHSEELSYRAFSDRVGCIQSLLQKQGIGKGDRIGILFDRTPDLLCALVAVLRTGAAYVPFLPDNPASRISYMATTAGVTGVLTEEKHRALVLEAGLAPLSVEDAFGMASSQNVTAPADTDPAYILFTSGSTGKPKGVSVPHAALENLLCALREQMDGLNGPVLCSANVTFDVFFTESLAALAQGMTVILADEEERMLPWKLAELIRRYRPQIAQFTPSRLQMCLRNRDFCDAIDCLAFTIVVGENMPAAVVSDFAAHCSGRLVNMYGPTEATVYVTAGDLHPDEPVTIGRPLQNCRLYILDRDCKPVLPGARGELYLAGVCLANGYESRPDLTAEAFPPDPFFSDERMYRTGDICRLRVDGRFECFGRTDGQIKINGIRLEIGEVNEAILSAGATDAVTVCRKNADGSSVLESLVCPYSLNVAELRARLSGRVPAYMIPSVIVTADRIPVNASGKNDMPEVRRILSGSGTVVHPDMAPAEQGIQPVSATAKDLPVRTENDTLLRPGYPVASSDAAHPKTPDIPVAQTVTNRPEQPASVTADVSVPALLSVWRTVLDQDSLTPDQSFFEQGGSSLSALNVLSEYYNRGIRMTLSEFYATPTASAQSALLSRHADRAVRYAGTADLSVTNSESPTGSEHPEKTAPISQDGKKAVFLTGASGFFGAHLLKALLDKGYPKVICLIREESTERFREVLTAYFGASTASDPRIELFTGDLLADRFGASEERYLALADRVGLVIHAAADVRHFASDDRLFRTNVEGTEQILRFVSDCGAPLLHISTASISGSFLKNEPDRLCVFAEADLDIGQELESPYLRSKLEAEKRVLVAVEQGLDARIFRIGRLVGRASDGVFQKNPDSNAFYKIMQGIDLLRAIPASLSGLPVELSPVDASAAAVLALKDAPGTVFHVVNPKTVTLGEIAIAQFPDIRILSDDAFDALLFEKSADSGGALAMLTDSLNRSRTDPQHILFSSERTQLLLHAVGFKWPEVPGHSLDAFPQVILKRTGKEGVSRE